MARHLTNTLIAWLLLAGSTAAQDVRLNHAAVPTHTIEIRPVTTIRSTEDIAVSGTGYLPHVGRGLFVHSSLYVPGRIHVFDSAGKLVKSLGRLGSGPGEFRGPLALFRMPGDSILVLDTRNARVSVISPNLEIARSVPIRVFPRSIIWLPGGGYVAADFINRPDRIGHPFHVMSATHDIVASFGYDGKPSLPGNRFEHEKHIAPSSTGQFWAVLRWRYGIELWDVSGRKIKAFTGKPAWFVNEHQGRTPSPNGPPPPTLLGAVYQDESGNLWVVYNVAAENWKAAFDSGRRGPHGPEPAVDRLYDSIIEVFNPGTGNLLARARFDRFVRGVSGKFVFGEITAADGAEHLSIWSLHLVPRTPSRW